MWSSDLTVLMDQNAPPSKWTPNDVAELVKLGVDINGTTFCNAEEMSILKALEATMNRNPDNKAYSDAVDVYRQLLIKLGAK